ncbi:MAG: hypothetical protein ACFFC6_15255 [Promethearchaeota archaeon]
MRFKSIFMISFLILLIGMLSGCTEPEPSQDVVLVVMGVSGEIKEYTLAELKEFTSSSGTSEYQNSYGNWKDKGVYKGVLVSKLAEEVGGIQQGDIMIATSEDNYTQVYPYENIYPSTAWKAIQGEMILAYELNETEVPDWEDGLRIAFLPTDEQFSNEDSDQTSSLEAKGAASRKWSKWVTKVEFRRETENVTFGFDSTNYTLSWSQVLKLRSINQSGCYITRENEVSDLIYYKGVNLTSVLDLMIDLGNNFTVEIVASDGYSRTFTRDQFFGNTTLYDSAGNEIGHGGPENVTLILAYYEGDEKLASDSGPFRSVYVGSNSPITSSKYRIRSVVYIKIVVE